MARSKFSLVCTHCGSVYEPHRLHCDRCDGLLRSHYEKRSFEPRDRLGLFAFTNWLPASDATDLSIGSSVYPSDALAAHLGLSNLAIAFSGYAPTVGALNPTGSFKDFEAAPTILYYREHGIESLVLASAGNTARAFAYAAVKLDFPVVIVIPERALDRLWIPCKPSEAIRLVVLEGCDDYAAAIRTAEAIGRVLKIASEGGARNVARRDGMSTAMLEYARQMRSLPDHYVQAIGSGTGAVATWEAAQRLIDAGVGTRLPALHLSQNAPFTPIHDAWSRGIPIHPDEDVSDQLRQIDVIDAPVLANRKPPYDVPGGVRDALTATEGHTYAVTNAEAREAAALFKDAEGLAIGPAAAVATASLLQAIDQRRIAGDDAVLLHITGNNEAVLQQDAVLHRIEPVWTLRTGMPDDKTIRLAAHLLR